MPMRNGMRLLGNVSVGCEHRLLNLDSASHDLEDAGKHDEAKKVTEGRKIYTFMASGVALKKVAKKLHETTFDHFGTGITEGKNVPIADALKDPAAHTDKPLRLEGDIIDICQTKGCWMRLGDPKNPVMVKFKDYGFFMPKDGAGRTAIIEGTMKLHRSGLSTTFTGMERVCASLDTSALTSVESVAPMTTHMPSRSSTSKRRG